MIDASRFAAIAESIKQEPSNEQLAEISRLARLQRSLEAKVAALKLELADFESELDRVTEHDLPEAMRAVGMTDFGLEDGSRVEISKEYYAHIPSPNSDKPELLQRRADAFAWLRSSGNEDLIKAQIVIEAGRGEQEKARR